MGLAVLAGVIVVAGLAVIAFNRLTHLRQLADNAWADIDVQLKRRHDLIPSVVSVVKGHAGYEKGTLEAVVEARSRALQARGPAARGAAEGGVTGSLHRIFAIAEGYPDLKAAESFLELQRTLTEVEDHLQQARRYYNAVVRDYNTAIGQFPSNLVARVGGFREREFFGLEDGSEAAAPELRLGTGE
jgi:LemA protein